MDLDRLVRVFQKIRDKQSELTADYEKAHGELEIKKKELQAYMLSVLNESNVQSVRTDAGTFYKKEKIIPQGADWGRFYKWVADNDGFDFLERRIKATAVKAYMDQNDGDAPPGVSVYRQFDVGVRKS